MSPPICQLEAAISVHSFQVKGVSHTFLKMVELKDGTADSIEETLLGILSKCDIPISTVCSFGIDGVAVMTGRQSGVAACLKGRNPEIISIHCGAHRLALASSQAAQHVPYMKSFDSHLFALYYHFKNSSVREASLHQIQVVNLCYV